ncbi:MAG: reverse transcriptase domain-containing protein, partial [Candidatus Eremiobacterota bacterium]
ENYTPTDIRRVNIPKDGTTEIRPIGIIATIEKIIQECVRMIIEPILEAQFFDHSYGFRPLRDAHMALERIQFITHRTGYHWAIEGDISKFFDCVNHNVLLGALFHMGIRDSRILQMIKAMLKAGIMNEVVKNELGVPQGSNLSPLLANVYLNRFDHYITREWEEKKLERKPRYDEKGNKDFHIFDVLRRKIPIIKPRYLIRYSDDWLIVTNSLENAKIIRYKIKMFLQNTLKLTLSEKKTRITNMKKKSVRFLGFEIRVRPGKSRSGIINSTKPDRERLRKKIQELKKDIHGLGKAVTIGILIHRINLYNQKVRGMINYYSSATLVNKIFSTYGYHLKGLIHKKLKRNHTSIWTPARETANLPVIHSSYTQVIPAVKYNDILIGVTSLAFVKWKKAYLKNPRETIYTEEGREIYRKRTKKERSKSRPELLIPSSLSEKISKNSHKSIYNFEYYMNRGYTYNRDRGKCRVCMNKIDSNEQVVIHHIDPSLALNRINRISNLATVHADCHRKIHSSEDLSKKIIKKVWDKIKSFRGKLKE